MFRLLTSRSQGHMLSSFRKHKDIHSLRHNFKICGTRAIHTLPKSVLFESLTKHEASSTAVIHSKSGKRFTYGNLLHDVVQAKEDLALGTDRGALNGQRIAFFAENGYDYVVTLLSIIASGAVALPLAPTFPDEEVRHILADSSASKLLATPRFKAKAYSTLSGELAFKPTLSILPKIEPSSNLSEQVHLDAGPTESGGFMLYTSGTTSRPKGVVLSTSVINAQAQSLIEAWDYRSSDLLLHVLPLHHIHGTINALYTPLIAGAAIEFLYPFNASAIWERFAAPFLDSFQPLEKQPISFFTVVPTIYSKLISTLPELDDQTQQAARKAVSPTHLRLNISGSAALPAPVKDAWTRISSGNVLLERYGMTEVGMALSCGLDFGDRVDGSVGWPLPGVEVRLIDTETGAVIEPGEEYDENDRLREGEIQLRGPTVFSEYWRNPTATVAEFSDAQDGGDKWFKTGDIAVRQNIPAAGKGKQPWAKGPMYFIKGRKSVDIIKTGGEKVSALEVERELLSLPQIAEAAVLGTHSDVWGQQISAIVVLTATGKESGKHGKPWGPMDMRRALKDRLAGHKIPQNLKVVESIPRNAMGKINKKALLCDFYPRDCQ